MHFVDNEGARYECINGLASNPLTQELVTEVLRQEEELGTQSWFVRVPSAGNVADTPSRPELPLLPLLKHRATRVQPASLTTWGHRDFLKTA